MVAPVGWRAFYLPADRYKFGKVWEYVSIEDDSGAYPVKYYYRPNSIQMLRLLSRRPAKSQPRANRVIGFSSWQEAMLAGYRPDPISLPKPASDLRVLAAAAGISPQLEKYTELAYAGQIRPEVHARNMQYVQQVVKIAYSRQDARPYLPQTVALALGYTMGLNNYPKEAVTADYLAREEKQKIADEKAAALANDRFRLATSNWMFRSNPRFVVHSSWDVFHLFDKEVEIAG